MSESNSRVAAPPRTGQSTIADAGTTGLQRATPVVEGEIVTADEYNASISVWQKDGFNILTPAVALGTIPKDHRIVVSRVSIDPNPAHGEVYQNTLFTKNGEVAISKVGLEKLAQCAGINIERIERLDSGTVPFFWEYQAYGWWLGFDGTIIQRTKGRQLDLRDGSKALKGFTDNQIDQARIHGPAVCESKAINRLYRTYGIKQKYFQAELARPFIVCKMRYEPDMSNPLTNAIVNQLRMGATKLLFPMAIDVSMVDPLKLPEHARPRTAPPAADMTDEDDPEPAKRAAPPLAGQAFGEEPPAPAAAAPRDAALLKVLSVTHDGAGGFLVEVENGQKLHTADRAVALACETARKAGTALAFDVEKRPNGVLEIVELTAASSPY